MEIFGKNSIVAALASKTKIEKVFLDKIKYQSLIPKLNKLGTKIFDFNSYKGNLQNHQKIVAEVNDLDFYDLDELIEKSFEETKTPILVMVDKITDPQNLGAIIRNLIAFNINGLIIPKFNQSPITGTVVKASAGSTFFANLSIVTSLNNSILKLKKKGFWIVATDSKGDKNLVDIKNINKPLVIILGSENEGISSLLLKNSDFKLSISISNKIDSLNVASTSAIIFHSLTQK